jgi:hypothetical protein
MRVAITYPCYKCDGDGKYEIGIERPHNSSRDVGEIEAKLVRCETCNSVGKITCVRVYNDLDEGEGHPFAQACEDYPEVTKLEEEVL